ncbi:MAG: hypothetical protein K8R49_06970 [Candidatus Cloacimonetes bacterium]|nr:hypothetical protein [Candidatus Cloacimonadota bacterium]
MKSRSSSLWILVAVNVYWTLIVLLSIFLYISPTPDNMEGMGFVLMFAGLPSSMLISLFSQDISTGMQIFWMILFGYIQFNVIGSIVLLMIRKTS